MKHFLLFTITFFLLLSCNNDSTKIYSESDNTIEGTLHYEYDGDYDDKVTVSEFSSLDLDSRYYLDNNGGNIQGEKYYYINFKTESNEEKTILVYIKKIELIEEVKVLEDGSWRYNTIEEQLAFFQSPNGLGLIYRGASKYIPDEKITFNSKIVDTETGQGVLVEIELQNGLLGGRNTIYEGEYYYDEYYSVDVKNLRVQFVVEFDTF